MSHPSGLQITTATEPGWDRVSSSTPLRESQRQTVASVPALASSLPSGENATLVMWLVYLPDQTSIPSATFHTLTVPSQLPVASMCSSGLKVSDQIMSVCP